MYKIYIVEDDPIIASVIKQQVESWGYSARTSEDYQNILQEYLTYQPHLVLMDITLPFYNGYHWCGEIRKYSSVPIIFISSASDNLNVVMAMNMGGDDFVSKPFNLDVLTAKVQAVLRRTYDYANANAKSLFEYQGAVIDSSDASISYNEEKLELSKNEFKILTSLLEKKGQIVSRDTLMEKLWATDSFVDENTLSVNVARLRRRLDSLGLKDVIETKKGLGYRLK